MDKFRNDGGPPSKYCTPAQYYAGLTAMMASVLSFSIIISWMAGEDLENGYLGGLNWGTLIFNWHPIFMSIGLILSFVWSALSFRIFTFGKPINKLIHSTLHTISVIFLSLGLYAVFASNNDKNKNTTGTYSPNLASLHSWIGIGTISLYCLNYLLGMLFFLTDIFSDEMKAWAVQQHRPLGLAIFILATLAASTGTMELSSESSVCNYDLSSPDNDPASHYKDLTDGCKLANGASLMIILTCVCAVYALLDLKPSRDGNRRDTEIPV